MKNIESVHPENIGWLEIKLEDNEINHLWKCVENKGENMKYKLAGQVDSSNRIYDIDNYFFNNVLMKCMKEYALLFGDQFEKIPTSHKHPFYLNSFWVNYQKQGEFNPIHFHDAIYSFVIWMKNPTSFEEQNQNPISLNANSHHLCEFNFVYTNILGKICSYRYEMSSDVEGTMLFFPSELIHNVHPFFNCTEDRISISGNLSLKSNEVLE